MIEKSTIDGFMINSTSVNRSACQLFHRFHFSVANVENVFVFLVAVPQVTSLQYCHFGIPFLYQSTLFS